jgi:hypothetical protein
MSTIKRTNLETGRLRDDDIDRVTGGSDIFTVLMAYQRMLNAEARDDRKLERSPFHPFQLLAHH